MSFFKSDRERLIEAWEHQNNCKLITIIHSSRDESALGSLLSVSRSVDLNQAEKIKREINKLDTDKNIDIIIHTSGGDAASAKMICDVLLNHNGRIRVYVPMRAFSAGTLIALTANELYLHKNTHLSPFDPQLIAIPASSIIKCLRPESGDIMNVLADMSQKSNRLIANIYDRIKDRHSDPNKLKEIFMMGDILHQNVLSVEECKAGGVKVAEGGIPDEIQKIFDLCL